MGNGQSRLLANQRAVWPPVWLYYPTLLCSLSWGAWVSCLPSYPSILAIQIIISLLRSDYNSNPKRKENFILVLVAVAGSVSGFFILMLTRRSCITHLTRLQLSTPLILPRLA